MGLHTKLQGRPLYIFHGSLFALSFFIFTRIDLPTNFFFWGGGGFVTAEFPLLLRVRIYLFYRVIVGG